MTLAMPEPVHRSLWHRDPRPEDDQAVRLYTAALEVIRLLGQGWTRNKPHCDLDTYSPEVVRHRLRHFSELIAAANGVGASGADAIGSAGETDSRRTLMAIKADIEQGTDHGLYTILNWRQAERIYKRQQRHDRYRERLALFRATWREDLAPEPWGPLAEAICIERIARSLGWYPHETCEERLTDVRRVR